MPQQTVSRLRLPLLAAPIVGALLLAGCATGTEPPPTSAPTSEPAPQADFSVMVAQANDQDDYLQKTLEAYAAEVGINIEVIPYPTDTYNTQVTTQLQAGNAADVMILSPGTGQAVSIVTLAEAGLLEPVPGAASVIPAGSEQMYEVDGNLYGQPIALMPISLVYNGAAAERVGITEFPTTFDDMLEACTTARAGGASFTVIAGAIPINTGYLAQLISATRVYASTPDWNAQRMAGKTTFADSKGWQETLETIVALNEGGCFQDGAAGGTFDVITGNIISGASLTAPLPGSAATSIGAASGVDFTVEVFPPATGQKEFVLASATYAWGLNAKASDDVKASVQDFLAWVGTDEQSVALAELAGMVPIKGATEANLVAPFKPIAGLLQSGSFAELPNAGWPNPAVYATLGTGVQGLLTGQTTVDQVLAEMDGAWGN